MRDGNINLPLRQYLWADAIYVRDWMALGSLDERQLRKYALLAHDLLGSFDPAHCIVAELDARCALGCAPRNLERLVTAAGA